MHSTRLSCLLLVHSGLRRSGSQICWLFWWKNISSSPCCGIYMFILCQEVPLQSGEASSSRVEVTKHLVRKAGFSREVVEVVALDLSGSAAALYQGVWFRFFHWCGGRSISPWKATVQQTAEFSVSAEGTEAICACGQGLSCYPNHVFSLVGLDIAADCVVGLDIAADCVVSRMFCSFKKTCSPREVKPPDWNLSLVLQSLICPPYEPLKLSLDKHLTWILFLACSCIGQEG